MFIFDKIDFIDFTDIAFGGSSGDTTPLLKNASAGVRIEAGSSQTFNISWFTDDATAKIVEVIDNPRYGYLTISTDKKSITYRQYAKQPNLFDYFKIKISNDENKEGIVRCYIDLYGYPIAPKGDMIVTPINTPVDINPMNNDSGAYLSLYSVENPLHGSITKNGDTIIYTPNQDYTGVDVISYTVEAGGINKEDEFVYIYVEPEEAIKSYAKADFALTDVNIATTINVLDNDAEGVTLNRIDEQPKNGTATISNNVIIYTPNKDYIGEDSFTYIATDEKSNELTAKVYIYVKETITKTSCSIGKCKIIANDTNQGVAVITNPNIELTLSNNTDNVLDYMNGGDVKEVQPNSYTLVECGNEYIELYKLYDAKVEVHNIAEYPISFDDNVLPVDVYNKTGSDKYIYRDSNGQVISDNGSYVRYNHCKFVDAIGDENNTYQEPTRPVPPIPAHYSDISLVTLTDYTINVTATSDFDVNISNITSADITPKDTDGNDLSVLSNNTSTVYTQDVMFSSGGYLTYTEPTRPTPPTPANYSNFTVIAISDTIDVTATNSEDCDIINNTGGDINVGATAVANGNNIVITENKTISL